jgi:hypothetical protein
MACRSIYLPVEVAAFALYIKTMGVIFTGVLQYYRSTTTRQGIDSTGVAYYSTLYCNHLLCKKMIHIQFSIVNVVWVSVSHILSKRQLSVFIDFMCITRR